MPPRTRPECVGTEEHWQHICECKPSKHCLLDRHTLAELSDLLLNVDKYNGEETQRSKVLQQRSFSSETSSSAKKVKGGQATLAHLADQWLLQSTDALKNPFSKDIYQKLLKEGEQFLWAGFDMDPVRTMAKKLVDVQRWAEGVRSCLAKIENEYAEEAKKLAGEIESTLSSSSKLLELENLYNRSCHLGILVKGSKKLAQKISSMEEWLNRVRIYLLEKRAAAIEIDSLYKLKSEVILTLLSS
ncbi:hypothetical protein ACJRO7_025951 [Eucalyptus globulus]|uniref:Uncharacterized protein n=1 Tax=Eucalyptus globulus TaxID=34317 RepID=A0ABD3KJ76_EUCGL